MDGMCYKLYNPLELSLVHNTLPSKLTASSSGSIKKDRQTQSLVGGFNPCEKYWSKWEYSPSRGEHKKYLKPPARICIFSNLPPPGEVLALSMACFPTISSHLFRNVEFLCRKNHQVLATSPRVLASAKITKKSKDLVKAKCHKKAGTSRMPKKNINHQEEIKSYGERHILNMFEVA